MLMTDWIRSGVVRQRDDTNESRGSLLEGNEEESLIPASQKTRPATSSHPLNPKSNPNEGDYLCNHIHPGGFSPRETQSAYALRRKKKQKKSLILFGEGVKWKEKKFLTGKERSNPMDFVSHTWVNILEVIISSVTSMSEKLRRLRGQAFDRGYVINFLLSTKLAPFSSDAYVCASCGTTCRIRKGSWKLGGISIGGFGRQCRRSRETTSRINGWIIMRWLFEYSMRSMVTKMPPRRHSGREFCLSNQSNEDGDPSCAQHAQKGDWFRFKECKSKFKTKQSSFKGMAPRVLSGKDSDGGSVILRMVENDYRGPSVWNLVNRIPRQSIQLSAHEVKKVWWWASRLKPSINDPHKLHYERRGSFWDILPAFFERLDFKGRECFFWYPLPWTSEFISIILSASSPYQPTTLGQLQRGG